MTQRNATPKNARSRRISGSGPYQLEHPAQNLQKTAATVQKAMAPLVGAIAGYASGGIPGAAAGITAGAAFNKIAGFGSYTIQKNSLFDSDVTDKSIPTMHNFNDSVRIKHREFITDLSSSVLFSLLAYPVNPGLSTTFPWLSSIAASFEQYEFLGLAFYFRSTSADALNSTNTSLGTVVMAANYNSADPNFQDKRAMEVPEWHTSNKPSEDQILFIECDRMQTSVPLLYVRTAGVQASTDIRFSDLCNFQVGAVGSQAAAVVGELHVMYDIVLHKPTILYGAPSSVLSARYQMTGVAAATPLGTAWTIYYNNIPVVVTGTTVTFPSYISGSFVLNYFNVGGAAALTSPLVTLTNCTALNIINASTANSATYSAAAVSAYQTIQLYVTVPKSSTNSVITFGTAGTVAGTNGDLLITQINAAI